MTGAGGHGSAHRQGTGTGQGGGNKLRQARLAASLYLSHWQYGKAAHTVPALSPALDQKTRSLGAFERRASWTAFSSFWGDWSQYQLQPMWMPSSLAKSAGMVFQRTWQLIETQSSGPRSGSLSAAGWVSSIIPPWHTAHRSMAHWQLNTPCARLAGSDLLYHLSLVLLRLWATPKEDYGISIEKVVSLPPLVLSREFLVTPEVSTWDMVIKICSRATLFCPLSWRSPAENTSVGEILAPLKVASHVYILQGSTAPPLDPMTWVRSWCWRGSLSTSS